MDKRGEKKMSRVNLHSILNSMMFHDVPWCSMIFLLFLFLLLLSEHASGVSPVIYGFVEHYFTPEPGREPSLYAWIERNHLLELKKSCSA